ncbi:heavy metal translocating P-type ATPase [Eggerthella sp. YY7918]|uniref:heavy metal translocating P-type ATPase n=1 Tax=Eggerthella sp. (strain YY7918) TaxID=502558 RepID=UPI000217193F|nr:heavy metal translocating P-type ATPase [Eggerthella sp. YY7918]BAK44644.1 cation transport ATPase [Eggerthella sp. YY7918]
MNKKQKRTRNRILIAIVLFVVAYIIAELMPLATWLGTETAALWAEFALFLIPYLIAGYDVLLRAAKNIGHGQVFDENFLMSVATIGAFALVLFPDSDPHMAEGAAVMLFYQVGELFQSYAVGKSRASIAEMMDIAPDFANVERDGELVQVDPYEVAVGDEIIVKPGERVPIDGIVLAGSSQLDTAALTGESMPREVREGDEIISGCVNLTGLITVRTTKPFGESTVSRILELVENAAEKKARTENFITRFARYYTPAVVGIAVLLAVIPPLLLGQSWSDWVQRGLIFLVVSCPCALVISVPLSFFGGIGGASRLGILVKGSNYLETLAHTETVVFDKTGTLTDGSFNVVAVHAEADIDADRLLSVAAHAEAFSNHPIALSVQKAYAGPIDKQRIADVEEQSGHGVRATVDERVVYVGNDKLMRECGVDYHDCELTGTILHVSLDGAYVGHIVIADVVKPDATAAIEALRAAGVKKTVMLTGDRTDVAAAVADELGLDEFRAQLLPQDKVAEVEKLLGETHAHGTGKGKLAFVGDGINDAPVLTRADIGIAMGAMGSDAAIEAADVVLMDDKPSNIAKAIRIARTTMRIVWQNIVFALGVKLLVLVLAAVGIANMWLAVFADVGVAVIAILNAMRAMNVRNMK